MCRIAGIINISESEETLGTQVKKMCDVMAHGGPDDEGLYVDGVYNLAFGHRRLALIDISSGGHQPMFYNEKQLCITYNGEVYNYRELKKELESLNCSFISESDTEVILAAYATWGIESFGKLSGMFVFALFDKQKQKTYLVRDPYGIKPLYYSTIKNALIFASEARAFKTLPYQYLENPNWRTYFLAFGHIPEPYTTFEEVKMLPKASMLVWDHKTSMAEFQKYEQTENKESPSKTRLKQVVKEAVKAHLISDAPIGVLLSGGIDSSILAIEASSALENKNTLNTLSIFFEEKDFSEKDYQDLVVDQIKSCHSSYFIDEKTFADHFNEALNSMDQPSTDGINAWFICRFAKENGLKAVLSGIGADELFGGYPSFKRMAAITKLAALPKFILNRFLKADYPAIKRLYYLRYRNSVGKYLALRGFFCPDEIAAMLNCSVEQVDEVLSSMEVEQMPKNLRPREQASWLESNMYMQNQLLKDEDAMSMQHGVELRVPFLDKNITKTLRKIPYKKRFDKKRTTALFSEAFKDVLDEKILNRKKMGFTFPFGEWLKHNAGFTAQMDVIQNKKAKELTSSFKNGQLHWSKALAIYQCFGVEKEQGTKSNKDQG